ncbi:uncharacterized protein DUF397 [Murinocardiopsis flavida]|uniref:Uncharacterized protein DUF397 n=1 Tax=Murinocardiopsis flavida TaxID=645275 RepID=A0A2P8DG49_9ACTN|nr:DUF397 domain-containing protein [Murinocardiopsis flavida]PSK96178.1 uncharacterized protein DUF397 [Murinocardiopsis flavida]
MTRPTIEDTPAWYKSSYSTSGGRDCVEVAHTTAGVLVRDSTKPEAGHLSFTPREWECFLNSAGKGEFHHPR